ncbi:hypothetical protein SS50377_28406 [Spironucleus salmonicida]|uniref:Uncharacterized protein n=1 Tax=Spironucleus salmonicida TaxID=348837 RepID=V6LHL8_9EUKA|nr:hypothetical protein SS50377_28406 [Spironucleus salmonicida]|eukprot:EST43181.1 Hypothetical protein SS50377_17122 [Spironucleus salmonicida]
MDQLPKRSTSKLGMKGEGGKGLKRSLSKIQNAQGSFSNNSTNFKFRPAAEKVIVDDEEEVHVRKPAKAFYIPDSDITDEQRRQSESQQEEAEKAPTFNFMDLLQEEVQQEVDNISFQNEHEKTEHEIITKDLLSNISQDIQQLPDTDEHQQLHITDYFPQETADLQVAEQKQAEALEQTAVVPLQLKDSQEFDPEIQNPFQYILVDYVNYENRSSKQLQSKSKKAPRKQLSRSSSNNGSSNSLKFKAASTSSFHIEEEEVKVKLQLKAFYIPDSEQVPQHALDSEENLLQQQIPAFSFSDLIKDELKVPEPFSTIQSDSEDYERAPINPKIAFSKPDLPPPSQTLMELATLPGLETSIPAENLQILDSATMSMLESLSGSQCKIPEPFTTNEDDITEFFVQNAKKSSFSSPQLEQEPELVSSAGGTEKLSFQTESDAQDNSQIFAMGEQEQQNDSNEKLSFQDTNHSLSNITEGSQEAKGPVEPQEQPRNAFKPLICDLAELKPIEQLSVLGTAKSSFVKDGHFKRQNSAVKNKGTALQFKQSVEKKVEETIEEVAVKHTFLGFDNNDKDAPAYVSPDDLLDSKHIQDMIEKEREEKRIQDELEQQMHEEEMQRQKEAAESLIQEQITQMKITHEQQAQVQIQKLKKRKNAKKQGTMNAINEFQQTATEACQHFMDDVKVLEEGTTAEHFRGQLVLKRLCELRNVAQEYCQFKSGTIQKKRLKMLENENQALNQQVQALESVLLNGDLLTIQMKRCLLSKSGDIYSAREERKPEIIPVYEEAPRKIYFHPESDEGMDEADKLAFKYGHM